MFYPVLGGVLSEGNVLDTALVKALVKLEENAEANSRESRMCQLWEDVVAREAVIGGEAAGAEELLNRRMRELHNTGTVYFDDRDQAGTCAKNFFLGVLRAPTRVNRRSHFDVEIDHDGFRKLFSTEGAN
jgi:hypothetical protein